MRIGIDIGGTFTDFVFFDEATGQFKTQKILSTPNQPAQAVLNGLAPLNETAHLSLVHGSTVATNALLERKGAATALVTTKGFRDLLEIGRQNRPDIYDLFSRRPPSLVPAARRFEIAERVDHHGQPIHPLKPADIEALVDQLQTAQVEAVAISFLFSFLYPHHENQVAHRLREAGLFVSSSHEILPEFREYERTSTTVVNAYVSPVMDRYLAHLEAHSQATELRIMQSNGGSIRASQARREAVRCVLSGPAGGVVGARYVAQTAGFQQLLTFDMGGTSTDVSLCDGEIQITTEADIGGLPIRIPVIDIHTVGAGGGSLAYVDVGGALRVGPQSAGADPGPICYGQGGQQPTVTDANLILGRLPVDEFLGGAMRLEQAQAEAALTKLAQQANLTAKSGLTLAQTVALGVVAIANAHMERALRVISVQRGHDPRDFVLVSFGGAGGLHAADLARSLNIPRVLIPPHAATLSAFGMLTAEVIKDYAQTVMLTGAMSYETLADRLAPLLEQGRREVIAEGVPADQLHLEPLLDMRYQGQSYELMIPFTANFAADFQAAHQRAYGYHEPEMPLEIVNLRLRVIGHLPSPTLPASELITPNVQANPFDSRPVVSSTGQHEVPFYRGLTIQPGHQIIGPAIVVHPDTTVFVGHQDRLSMDAYRNLIIEVATDPTTNRYTTGS